MKRKPDLSLALLALIACIDDDGMEYPDAHHHIIDLYGLTVREGEILTDMYDRYDEYGGGVE